MSGLKNLNTRLNYRGGDRLERMRKDKLRALQQAMRNSYQAETLILADGREFRCLINPNKLSMELDDKMLSVPFEDVCLNREHSPDIEGELDGDTLIINEDSLVDNTLILNQEHRYSKLMEEVGVKPGDVITWKENGTHWLIYMRYLQEDAYFRGLMRQCDEEVEINGTRYWVYLKGPSEKGINWQKTSSFVFNKLNYTLEMYISNNQETNEFFHRFKKLKVKGRPWEVQAIDDITTDGIIAVYLKEDYTNEYAETQVEDSQSENDSAIEQGLPRIIGDSKVYPFDIKTYNVENIAGGSWSLSNGRAKILTQSESSVEIEITTGKSGDVSLIYKTENDKIVFNITIQSL